MTQVLPPTFAFCKTSRPSILPIRQWTRSTSYGGMGGIVYQHFLFWTSERELSYHNTPIIFSLTSSSGSRVIVSISTGDSSSLSKGDSSNNCSLTVKSENIVHSVRGCHLLMAAEGQPLHWCSSFWSHHRQIPLTLPFCQLRSKNKLRSPLISGLIITHHAPHNRDGMWLNTGLWQV